MPYFTFLDSFLGIIGVKYGPQVHDDSFMDRLNYYHTTIILCFFFIWVVTEEHAGKPILCWCPDEFTPAMQTYTEYVCWVSNTYYIPFSKPIPPEFDQKETEVTYYQFVPFIILIMALCFSLPRHMWKYMAQKSGVPVKKMLAWTAEACYLPDDEREELIFSAASYIDSWCSGVHSYRGGICSICRENYGSRFSLGCGRHYGNYLVSLLIGTRFLYLINALGQLYLLNEFLGGDKFYLYGYEVAKHVIFLGYWPLFSTRFPTSTLCDFDFRQLTNVQHWTLHCLLPINLFNERFFIFLWFWISFITISNFLSFLNSLLMVFSRSRKRKFIKKHIHLVDTGFKYEEFKFKKNLKKFCNLHLRQDGIYLLNMVLQASSPIVVTEMIQALWEIYFEREERKRTMHMYSSKGKSIDDYSDDYIDDNDSDDVSDIDFEHPLLYESKV